jgi:hypothetical protein
VIVAISCVRSLNFLSFASISSKLNSFLGSWDLSIFSFRFLFTIDLRVPWWTPSFSDMTLHEFLGLVSSWTTVTPKRRKHIFHQSMEVLPFFGWSSLQNSTFSFCTKECSCCLSGLWCLVLCGAAGACSSAYLNSRRRLPSWSGFLRRNRSTERRSRYLMKGTPSCTISVSCSSVAADLSLVLVVPPLAGILSWSAGKFCWRDVLC